MYTLFIVAKELCEQSIDYQTLADIGLGSSFLLGSKEAHPFTWTRIIKIMEKSKQYKKATGFWTNCVKNYTGSTIFYFFSF